MERRISKILSHFNSIQEEKNNLVGNLNKLLDQLNAKIQKADTMPPKDLQNIITYQLSLLQNINELNFGLENFEMEHQLILDSDLTASPSSYTSPPVYTTEAATTSTKQPEPDTDISTALFTDQISSSNTASALFPHDMSSNSNTPLLPDPDTSNISALKDSFKKFHEKLGLTDFQHVEEFYQKPTGNAFVEVDQVEFEEPEKDVASCVKEEMDFTDSRIHETLGCRVKEEIEEVDPETVSSSSSNHQCPEDLLVFSSSSTSDTEDTIKPSSNFDDSHPLEKMCLTDVENKASQPLSNYENIEKKMTEQPPQVCSAVLKLNNRKLANVEEGESSKKTSNIPDMTLQPVIKNSFDSPPLLVKKKNKKKHKHDKVLYDVIEKSDPVTGTICAFSHVETPVEFYIHIVDKDCALIDTLTDKIKEHLDNTPRVEYSTKNEAFEYLGNYCFAFISQYNGWYRAQIHDWCLNKKSNEVYLQLVDYGNDMLVSYRKLQKLNHDFAEIPRLAVRCHLPLMYPPGSTVINRLTNWPSASIDALTTISGLFQQEINQNKIFKILYAQREGNSLAIDLHGIDEDVEHTVGQIILDLGLAVQIVEDEVDPMNLDLEMFLQENDEPEAENINEAITGYDAKDEARICRFARPDGTCFKGRNCKLEHVPLSKDGFTTDKELVFTTAKNCLCIPQHGESVNILITSCIDICTFYVQIVRNPFRLHKKDYSMDRDFYELLSLMNLPKNIKEYKTFTISPALGELVIAKHWTKKWLRGIVRDLYKKQNNRVVQVYMVDFGEMVDLPLSEVRKMNEEFLHLPFQAVQCYLFNYEQRPDADPKQVKDFFDKNLAFLNFHADVFRSSSPPLRVGIVTRKGCDIGVELEKLGFAQKRKHDNNVQEGCIVEVE